GARRVAIDSLACGRYWGDRITATLNQRGIWKLVTIDIRRSLDRPGHIHEVGPYRQHHASFATTGVRKRFVANAPGLLIARVVGLEVHVQRGTFFVHCLPQGGLTARQTTM